MSDEELFEKWWKLHSPPGTFNKTQCKVAFIAGLATQRVEAAQQSVQSDDGYCHCPITKTEAVLAGSLCSKCFRHRR